MRRKEEYMTVEDLMQILLENWQQVFGMVEAFLLVVQLIVLYEIQAVNKKMKKRENLLQMQVDKLADEQEQLIRKVRKDEETALHKPVSFDSGLKEAPEKLIDDVLAEVFS